MTDSNAQPLQKEADRKYKVELDSLDPERIGLRIKCPDCDALSWLKLPDIRYYDVPISICCPAACGAFNTISAFDPRACAETSLGDFDIREKCHRDGVQFALNGAIYRCPLCAIENPREVMIELLRFVKNKAGGSISRRELADLLGSVVSTFDGTMRRCNSIVRRNFEQMGLDPFPQVNSFQNLAAARAKMILTWDMSSAVSDWDKVVLIFQKRHLFAHALGVVDQEYIDKSGDKSSVIAKQVSLSAEEVVFLAEETTKIVLAFFGMFLSQRQNQSTAPYIALSAKHAGVKDCVLLPLPTVLDEYERANVVITARLVSINKTKEPDSIHFNNRSAIVRCQISDVR